MKEAAKEVAAKEGVAKEEVAMAVVVTAVVTAVVDSETAEVMVEEDLGVDVVRAAEDSGVVTEVAEELEAREVEAKEADLSMTRRIWRSQNETQTRKWCRDKLC